MEDGESNDCAEVAPYPSLGVACVAEKEGSQIWAVERRGAHGDIAAVQPVAVSPTHIALVTHAKD